MIDISVFWTPAHVAELGSALVVEAVRGLEVVDRQVFPISQSSPTVPIRCRDARGLTSVTLRYLRQATGGTTQPSLEALEIRNLRYRTRPRGARLGSPIRGGARSAAGRRRRQARVAAQPRLRGRADGAHDGGLPGQRAGGRGRCSAPDSAPGGCPG